MSPETLALIRTNRAAQAGIAAAVLLALVATARVVDSHSSKPVVTLREKGADFAAAASRPAPALALDGPLMPHYSAPQPPPVGPTVPDQPQAPAAVQAEAKAAILEREAPLPVPEPLPPPPAPRFPQMAPEPVVAPAAMAAPAPPPAAPVAPAPMPARSSAPYCPRCGEVIGLTAWPDMTEVHVRFQDGSTHAMRSGMPSRWRVGDHVRAEGGRLVAD